MSVRTEVARANQTVVSRLLLAQIVLLALCQGVLVAQSQKQDATTSKDAPTTFKVTSRAVVVDVVVTDHKGRPIHGLSEKNFMVTEDSAPQQIRYFHETVRASALPDQQASATDNKSPEKVASMNGGPTAATSNPMKPSEPGAVTLILFDALNTPPQDQVYARNQLVKFLSAKPADLQIGLCLLSAGGPNLHMVQGFTSDQRLLLAAAKADKIKQTVTWYRGSQSGTASAIDALRQVASGDASSGFQGVLSALERMQSEADSFNTDLRVAITIHSLMILSRYLSAIPGRKNVVWLSGSFPISIASSYAGDEPYLDNRDYSEAVKALTDLLSEAEISVYPVDVRGIPGFTSFTAEHIYGLSIIPYQGPANFSGTSVIAPAPSPYSELDSIAADRATLAQIAQATGGRAFFNTNGIVQAIATAADEGSNYYTVSYTPTNKNYDGKFRKIKVELADQGYKLHYRTGYFAVSAAANNVEVARQARLVAMQHASPPSRDLAFSAAVTTGAKTENFEREKLGQVLLGPDKTPLLPAQLEAQHYSINYSFKPQDLGFVSSARRKYRNSLVLMIGAYDSSGRMLSASSAMAVTELKSGAYHHLLDQKISLHQDIDIPASASWLRLGIQDQVTENIGAIELPLPLTASSHANQKADHQ